AQRRLLSGREAPSGAGRSPRRAALVQVGGDVHPDHRHFAPGASLLSQRRLSPRPERLQDWTQRGHAAGHRAARDRLAGLRLAVAIEAPRRCRHHRLRRPPGRRDGARLPAALCVAGALVRHAMIGRGPAARWALLPAALALAAAMFYSTPKRAAARTPGASNDSVPTFAAVRSVITQRCQPCHSQYQSDRTFGPAPGGVTFDTPQSITRLAARMAVRAVEPKTMPLATQTGMTE